MSLANSQFFSCSDLISILNNHLPHELWIAKISSLEDISDMYSFYKPASLPVSSVFTKVHQLYRPFHQINEMISFTLLVSSLTGIHVSWNLDVKNVICVCDVSCIRLKVVDVRCRNGEIAQIWTFNNVS